MSHLLHRDVYNIIRGRDAATKDGGPLMPHWDDLPEWLRSAMLAISLASAEHERDACAELANEHNCQSELCNCQGRIADAIRARGNIS